MAGSHHIERPDSKTAQALEKLIFGHRLPIVIVFAVLTALLPGAAGAVVVAGEGGVRVIRLDSAQEPGS